MKFKRKFRHLDAAQSAFFSRELERIKSELYLVEYPELQARTLLPVDFEGGGGIDSITYRMLDRVGMAKVIANYSDDLPSVNVFGKEYTAKVKELGLKYDFSVKEIRRAAQAGVPLRSQKADACKFGMLSKEDQLAWAGETESGLVGFLTHPNLTRDTAPADGNTNGGSSDTEFEFKTADQILRDMNSCADSVTELTLNVERPNTLLMPVEQYNIAKSTRVGTDGTVTVLKYFLENNGYIKEVRPVPALAGAGTNGVDVIVAYDKNPRKLQLLVPSDFEQLDEERRGLVYEVPCIESFAGVAVYYPLSISILEGV